MSSTEQRDCRRNLATSSQYPIPIREQYPLLWEWCLPSQLHVGMITWSVLGIGTLVHRYFMHDLGSLSRNDIILQLSEAMISFLQSIEISFIRRLPPSQEVKYASLCKTSQQIHERHLEKACLNKGRMRLMYRKNQSLEARERDRDREKQRERVQHYLQLLCPPMFYSWHSFPNSSRHWIPHYTWLIWFWFLSPAIRILSKYRK